MPFFAKQHSLLQHRDLMVDAAPLANQHSSCPHFARRRRRFHRTARSGIIGHTSKQATDSWFETVERALLRAVCNRISQQILLHPHRRCGSVCRLPARLPARLQFVVAEASEVGDFGGESLMIKLRDMTLHDCPSSNAGSHTHRSLPKLKPVLDAAVRPFSAQHGSELRCQTHRNRFACLGEWPRRGARNQYRKGTAPFPNGEQSAVFNQAKRFDRYLRCPLISILTRRRALLRDCR
jgi:hypothetical protein